MEQDKRITYLEALSRIYRDIVPRAFNIFLEVSANTFETPKGGIVQVRDMDSIGEESTILEVNSRLVDLVVEGSRRERYPKVKELFLQLHKEIFDYEQFLREGLN